MHSRETDESIKRFPDNKYHSQNYQTDRNDYGPDTGIGHIRSGFNKRNRIQPLLAHDPGLPVLILIRNSRQETAAGNPEASDVLYKPDPLLCLLYPRLSRVGIHEHCRDIFHGAAVTVLWDYLDRIQGKIAHN